MKFDVKPFTRPEYASKLLLNDGMIRPPLSKSIFIIACTMSRSFTGSRVLLACA